MRYQENENQMKSMTDKLNLSQMANDNHERWLNVNVKYQLSQG